MAKRRKMVDSLTHRRSRAESGGADPEQRGTVGKPRSPAKSTDPAYMKFTTYIRKSTHLGVKTRLVSKEKELSELVEELLSNWLKQNGSFSI